MAETSDFNIAVGKAIKAARTEAGVTQEQLADGGGVAQAGLKAENRRLTRILDNIRREVEKATLAAASKSVPS